MAENPPLATRVLILVSLSDHADSGVRSVCAQHFPSCHVAATMAVWALIERAVAHPHWCNDYAGVLHDIMFLTRVRRRKLYVGDGVTARVKITGAGRRKLYDITTVVGIEDNGYTITLMFPNED